jgi:hypothetical protein
MKTRCSNPKRREWKWYGGRGITVCERWLTFENFLADMGECPPGLTLERRDPNGNYTPENCYWATWQEQARNRIRGKLTQEQADAIRRDTRRQIDIAADYGISQSMVSAIKCGLTWR